MSNEPKFMKIEMRPYIWVPFCYKCKEVRALKGNAIITDAARPKMDTWVCQVCGDEDELPPGFPQMRHEAVTVEDFVMPTLEGEKEPT